MLYGTPEGSIFGTMLWNLFFNPLLVDLGELKIATDQETERENAVPGNSIVVLDNIDPALADHLTIVTASEEPQRAERLSERKLEIFKNFLDERGMEASISKLKVMCLDRQKRDYLPCVRYGEELIEVVVMHRLLGIIYDKDMTFEEHWKHVASSVANRTKTMPMLRGVQWGPTQQTMIVVHHCYIESRIRYRMPAWYPFLAQNSRTSSRNTCADLFELQ